MLIPQPSRLAAIWGLKLVKKDIFTLSSSYDTLNISRKPRVAIWLWNSPMGLIENGIIISDTDPWVVTSREKLGLFLTREIIFATWPNQKQNFYYQSKNSLRSVSQVHDSQDSLVHFLNVSALLLISENDYNFSAGGQFVIVKEEHFCFRKINTVKEVIFYMFFFVTSFIEIIWSDAIFLGIQTSTCHYTGTFLAHTNGIRNHDGCRWPGAK